MNLTTHLHLVSSRAAHVFPMYAFVAWTGKILPLFFSCDFITIVRKGIFIPSPTLDMAVQEENNKLCTSMNMEMYRELSMYIPHWIPK